MSEERLEVDLGVDGALEDLTAVAGEPGDGLVDLAFRAALFLRLLDVEPAGANRKPLGAPPTLVPGWSRP